MKYFFLNFSGYLIKNLQTLSACNNFKMAERKGGDCITAALIITFINIPFLFPYKNKKMNRPKIYVIECHS